MSLAIVVPTIDGRERLLKRCVQTYVATLEKVPTWQLIVVRNERNCGRAWQKGMDIARHSGAVYVHLTADDIEAMHGWYEAARAKVDVGVCPCPRVLSSDLSIQSCGDWGTEMPEGAVTQFTRVPFIHMQWMQHITPMLDAHYYTDVWVSERLRAVGIETVVARDYLLLHHMASEGRLDTDAEDLAEYERRMAAR